MYWLAATSQPAEQLYHYANGSHECCGSNMADLWTATDPHVLAQWQFSSRDAEKLKHAHGQGA